VEGHSHIIIIMANTVRPGEEVNSLLPHQEVMRRNIEKATRPVVVFGLGAQAAFGKEVRYAAPESTTRLLRVISERSPRIAVRGKFTADALRRLSINNPEVIGCQSCFLSKEPRMMTLVSRWKAAFLAVAFLGGGFGGSAHAEGGSRLFTGVNVTGVAWMSASERRQTIEQLAANQVGAVRFTLHQPFDAVLDMLALAQDHNLPVVLGISLNIPAYFSPNTRRRNSGRVEQSYPLSTLDLNRFRTAFGAFWAEAERRQIKIHALQVGNEINWAFNGDLQSDIARKGQVYRNLEEMPNASAFLAGLDNYVAAVRVVRELRDGASINSGIRIISAGLARIRPDFASKTGADAVDAGLTYRLLTQRGLNQYVDSSSIHYYPSVTVTPAERREALDAALRECSEGQTRQSCWMTEWGISNTSTTCPSDDKRRAALVRETQFNLEAAAIQGKVAASFYFEWSGKSPRSVWRCGGLTEAGAAAVQPGRGAAAGAAR
jgi:hypothetical protein